MKEMLKSYGGTFLVVVGSLLLLGLVIGYLPKVLADRLPKF